jgi:ribosome-associated protein
VTDKLGEDIILLDIQKLTPFTDYFVICSGNSDRQLNAIVEGVDEYIKKRFGIDPRRVEGDGSSGWILIDYSDVVIHIFTPRTRSFYDLESLWKEAPIVLRML